MCLYILSQYQNMLELHHNVKACNKEKKYNQKHYLKIDKGNIDKLKGDVKFTVQNISTCYSWCGTGHSFVKKFSSYQFINIFPCQSISCAIW